MDVERRGVPFPVRFTPSVGDGLPAFMQADKAILDAVAFVGRQHKLYGFRKRRKTACADKEARQSKTLDQTKISAMHATLRFFPII